MPFLLLAGGEIVLALLALRVLVWIARGWSETFDPEEPPSGGPDGGGRPLLAVIDGEARGRREPRRELRPAA